MSQVVAVVLILAGTAFLAVSAVGVVRFPDFYTRAHVVAKSETLGIMLVVGGLIVHHGFAPGVLRLGLVVVFAMLANPTAIYAIARAARRAEVAPWTRGQP